MKKILSFLITLNILLAPSFVLAQTANPPKATVAPAGVDAYTDYLQGRTSNTQASGVLQGASQTNQGSGGATGAGKGASSCLIGNALASSLRSMLTGTTESMSSSLVPTKPVALTIKETGGISTGGMSLDGIGYCLVNTIIEYIGTATVKWINSGFKGNPVFIDDPSKFFSDIADIEAGNFLNELTGGYLCSSIQSPVRIRLANSYNNRNSSFNRRARCTFTGISGNMDKFIGGQSFSWQDWMSYTQNPYNNQLGATVYGQLELDKRIASSLGVQSKLADWGRGFLSYTDPETKKVYSPGALIEEQLNKQLDNPRQRLLVADEFDEIVTALVNQLIKVALNEITQATSGSRDTGSNYYTGEIADTTTNTTQNTAAFTPVQNNDVDVITPSVNWDSIKTEYSDSAVCSTDLSSTAPAAQCFFSYSNQYSDQKMVEIVSQIKNFAKNQGNTQYGITAQGRVSAIVVEFADGSKGYTFIDSFNGINKLTDGVFKLLSSIDSDGTRSLNKIYLFHTVDSSAGQYSCGFNSSPQRIVEIPNVLDIVQSAIFEAKLTKAMSRSISIENYVVTKNGEIFEYDLPPFSSLYSDLQNLATGSQIDQDELTSVLESRKVDSAVCVSNSNLNSSSQSLLKYIKSIKDMGAYIVETTKFNQQ